MSRTSSRAGQAPRLSGQAGAPILHDARVSMKHGGGGRAMRSLIGDVFARGFAEPKNGTGLAAMDDGATIRIDGEQWLVVTTDSHIIQPLFFPGGDIGRLSVSGTVNDLAMMGAIEPAGLTCSVIIEDGFSIEMLERIHESMVATCIEAGTTIVTGDTKVMGRGEIDGIVINTTGVGVTKRVVRDNGLRAGDIIIVTGTVGDHGMAIMAARHSLGLEGNLESDVAPINALIAAALDDDVVAMKDPTRGGVASALNEMAAKSNVGIVVDEPFVPILDSVRAASEIIGIDPLQVANEGKALLGVRPESARKVLVALQTHRLGRHAAIIGRCISEYTGSLILATPDGRRLLLAIGGV